MPAPPGPPRIISTLPATLPARGLRDFLRHPPGPLKATVLASACVFYAAAAFMYFEVDAKPELEWIDAMWWAVVTMTTVGFGDYFPASVAGRVFAGLPAMLVGMGMLGYLLTQFASFLVGAETFNRKGFGVQQVKDHLIICNFPSRSRLLRILAELRSHGGVARDELVLIDPHLEELPADLAPVMRFVRGHPTRPHVLERAGAAAARRAIVLAADPTDAASDVAACAICLTLRSCGGDHLHIVAECVDPDNVELLVRAGAGGVVCVQDLTPGILARELEAPGMARVVHELTQHRDEPTHLFMVPITSSGNETVTDLRQYSTAQRLTLVGLRTTADEILLNPPPHRPVTTGEHAIVLASERPELLRLNADSR